MPYKASGKTVLVKRGGRWVVVKRLSSEEKAQNYAAALNANVRHE